MKVFQLAIVIFFLSSFLLGSGGCDFVNPEEEIPAYIHIDSIDLKTPSPGQKGSSSHKIVDAWVKVGAEFIGVFELPATIPVLMHGEKEVIVRAGIKNNGIANTRGQYPFYKPILKNVDLQPKEIDSLGTLTTEYVENITFAWSEAFEDTGNIELRNNTNADVEYQLTSDSSEVFEGDFSLKFDVPKGKQFFEVQMPSRLAKDIPLSANVYMEANFKTDMEVKVGYIAVPPTRNSIKVDKVVLNETAKWNKIYINLRSDVEEYPPDYKFRIFIGAVKRRESPATVYLDNLKLIHE